MTALVRLDRRLERLPPLIQGVFFKTHDAHLGAQLQQLGAFPLIQGVFFKTHDKRLLDEEAQAQARPLIQGVFFKTHDVVHASEVPVFDFPFNSRGLFQDP